MANLGYRTFTGSNSLTATLGSLASQSGMTVTVAVVYKLNAFATDVELVQAPGYNPIDLFFLQSFNEASYSDGVGDDNGNGPHVAIADGWGIIVVAKDGTNPVGWSQYNFTLASWFHDASGNTLGSTGSFPGSGSMVLGASPTFTGDIACIGIWRGTKLNTTQRETLSVDFAAWSALSPSELWRMDGGTPGNAVVGSSTQVALTGTSLTAGGSPLAEGGASVIPQNLDATAIDHDSIGLTWTAVGGASGYDVRRSPAGAGTWTTIATDVATNSYTDNAVPLPSTAYDYQVRSVFG